MIYRLRFVDSETISLFLVFLAGHAKIVFVVYATISDREIEIENSESETETKTDRSKDYADNLVGKLETFSAEDEDGKVYHNAAVSRTGTKYCDRNVSMISGVP
ncbi:hypothetical protein TNCV_3172791 [Trichonephila clavipes]|nr:hypothetical protein TNCV_3172791 [Trichonephila clavipes]